MSGEPGYFGVHLALVTEPVDPASLGRVKVRFPWLEGGDRDLEPWATLCSPYGRGPMVLPEAGDQVVVAFEAGDLLRPYVLGATPSARRSPSGDTGHEPTITLVTAQGHRVVLDDAAATVTVAHAAGCRITLSPSSVTIQGTDSVDVIAPTMRIQTSAAEFTGVLKADTVVATSVVSSSYSPGAGNLI